VQELSNTNYKIIEIDGNKIIEIDGNRYLLVRLYKI
jgi:hypothetical protein